MPGTGEYRAKIGMRKRNGAKWRWLGPGSREQSDLVSRPSVPDAPRVGRPGGLSGSLSDNLSRVPPASGDDRNPRGGREVAASSPQHRSHPGSSLSCYPWCPRGGSRGRARWDSAGSHHGDPEPQCSTATGVPGTPQKLSARREKLPAAGPRRPPYLEVAPHVLGHGVVVDVEREGELGVGLQRRRRHQHHAAGVHLPSGCGTAGSYGTAVGRGARGWGRWRCGTPSPAAASSSPISSAGISRWVTSTTSLRVSSCRRSAGMCPPAVPQHPRVPRPGARGWAGRRAHGLRMHRACAPASLPASSSPSPPRPAGEHPPSSASRAAVLSPSGGRETLRHRGTLGCH